MSEMDRRAFVAPPATGTYGEINLSLLDPANPDDRRLLIEAEHPELRRALASDQREVHVNGEAMNPHLHIAMHEVVATQIWDDEPPETWLTAQRLLNAGYERHEVLHMLASVVSGEVYSMLHDGQPHDPERTRAALDALPESWEQQRAQIPEERHMNRAERRAAQRRHRH